MIYVENLECPNKLKKGSKLSFRLSDGEVHYGTVVYSDERSSYFVNFEHLNDIIFTKLGLKKYEFVRNIIGYSREGSWPEVDTLEDLEKVLNALLKVNRPVEEVKEVKTNPDTEWSWLLD